MSFGAHGAAWRLWFTAQKAPAAISVNWVQDQHAPGSPYAPLRWQAGTLDLRTMKLVESLLALGQLDHLPRTGWIQAGVPEPESIAGHVLGVCHLALATAGQVEPGLDLGRVLALILVHDAPEALSGDLPRQASQALPEGAKLAMEEVLAERLLHAFPADAQGAWTEWCAQDTREARFAKLCDRIQLGVRCLQLARSGQGNLDGFWTGLRKVDPSEFPPLVALLQEILAQAPEKPPTG